MSIRSLLLVLCVCLVATAATADTVTRGPYLQLGTPDGVVIRWRTDVATSSEVRYGTTQGNLSATEFDAAADTEHEIELTGLSPGTRYWYSVGAMGGPVLAGDDADHFFDTAPPVGATPPVRVWVLGDSGANVNNAGAVRDAYVGYTGARHTDLWLMLGDNAYTTGLDEEFQIKLFDVFPEMLRRSVLWPTIGNHDGIAANSGQQTGPYFDIFNLPDNAQAGGMVSGTESYYSFDYANIHFVVLDSHGSDRLIGGPMMDWLESDLAVTAQQWIIAYWHHPPYSKGGHDSDDVPLEQQLVDMRDNAVRVLEDHGVDLVMTGHSHSYERSIMIDGHYGFSDDFGPQHVVDPGDGREVGDGAYVKPAAGPHQGAVYQVAGSSSQLSGGLLNHPVMYVSHNVLGSVVLDVEGYRLDAVFLDSVGAELDSFTILKDPDLVVDFSATPESDPVPLSVTFSDQSLVEATQWEWDFDGDGTTDSTEEIPTHVYEQPGQYSVRLRITGPKGTFERTKVDFIDAFLAPPLADFVTDVFTGIAPLSVSFTDRSGNTPDQWEWDFDDDGTPDSTEQNPVHVYDTPGVYSVRLTVMNAEGTSSEIRSDLITVLPRAPDEVTGFTVDVDRQTMSWDPNPAACGYDLVRVDLAALRASGGDYRVSQLGCVNEDIVSTLTSDPTLPGPGQIVAYLARITDCGGLAGTFDTSGLGMIETRDPELQGPGSACGCLPGDDLDVDLFCNTLDNCPTTYNQGQSDYDLDGLGDVCDCDPTDWRCSSDCTDADADQFCVTTDCDDTNAAVNPTTTWFLDQDGDGFGLLSQNLVQCAAPPGYSLGRGDCDDISATAVDTYPGAAPNDSPTLCMRDRDHDGWGDDDPQAGVTSGTDCDDLDPVATPETQWFPDNDGDGFGDLVGEIAQCESPPGHTMDSTDCDDTSPTAGATYPGAAPNDDSIACMKDVDDDDWGDDQPPAGVVPGSDCNDANATANPTFTWYLDGDGDGFGDLGAPLVQCSQPVGHVSEPSDCDDASATTFPGAAPNDGVACMSDVDGDGWGDAAPAPGVAAGTDCDDSAADTFPGAAPNDSGVACMRDADGDDWGDDTPQAGATPGSDCDDTEANTSPDTQWYADTDGDGFGDFTEPVSQCLQPAEHVADATDCDDTSPTATDTYPGAAPNDSSLACMKDTDGDDWGDSSPLPGVFAGTDCDDDDDSATPDRVWYADTDGDGFGDTDVPSVQCTEPAGFVLDGTDCDDTSPSAADTHPGAAPNDSAGGCLKDVDGDDWGDVATIAGVTPGTDCDDSFALTFPGAAPNDAPAACYLDADGDDWGDENPPAGVTAGTDCDDSDAQLHPDTPWYADTDGDGFGDPGALTTQCLQPAGHLADATDCDDSSPAAASTFPGAAPNDSADGCLKDVDGDDWGDADPLPGVTPGSDCDDDDAFFNPTTTWYRDKDGDGFGDLAVSLAACTQPSGYLLDSTDCDDISVTSPATFPGAAPSDGAGCMRDSDGDDWGDDSPPAGVEAGTDCDDFDALLHPATTWYVDADGDGFGSSASTLVQCTEPAGFVPSSTDCDDVSPTASATFPGAAPNDSADACMKDLDGDDWGDASPQPGIVPGTDCDDADFGFNPGTTWYADTDGDGFGDPNVNVDQCSAPAGHVLDSTDCDDTSGTAADTHPGAAPNDSLVACMRDVDGDGWGDSSAVGAITPGTDCDDDSATASATHPSAAPNDGAGCMKDIDGDDWGDDDPPPGVGSGTDCDDADVQRNPDTVWYADTDADGYGDRFVTLAQCVQPAGYVAQSTDCDDTSPAAAFTFPGAAPNDDGFVCMKDVDGDDWGDEAPNAGVFPGSDCNDADPGLRPDTTWFADTDGDGFGDPALTVVQCDAPLAFVLVDTDCDDTSAAAAATFPGAAPNDSAVACMKDVDGDDWADASPSTPASPGTDCDDDSPTAADTYPGAAPNDSAIDCMRDVDGDDWGDETPPQDVSAGTDCDDDDEGIQPDTIWYADLDGDTFGDRFVTLVQCTQPTDHVLDSTDCDDVSATAAATFPGAAPNDNPVVCMKDADGDDYADQSPPAGIAVGTDCDDSDAVIHPQTIWHRDLDADGFGHPNVTLVQCVQPAGHVLNSMDCDDSSGTAAFTFPGAAPNDSAEICMRDVDGDDWGDDSPPGNIASGSDCDDGDPLVHPTTTWYADIDGDGFGDPGVSVVQCDAPASYRLDNTDCDDTSPTAAATYPGSAPNDNIACMRDVDGDNWGDANPPAGVSPGTDCDDNNEVVHPETMWYLDLDTDGFGDPGVSVTQCAQPDFHLLNNTDCDDSGPTAAFTFPGAALNDGAGCMKDVDDDDWGDDTPPPGVMAGTDCNDVDAVLTPVTVWHADTDTDGFGDPGVTQVQCPQPAGYLLDNTDCDDTSGTAAATYPGAAPNDGAGCMKDVDSDDWGDDNPPAGVSSGTDCDDTDSVLNPTTIWYADTDLDGFGDPGVSQVQCVQPAGHLLDSTDCDDTSGTAAATFPGAAPNDGGGCFKDVDGDDWGDDNPPAGVSSGTDCDDTDSVLNPTTIWYADTDLDGFGDPGVSQVQCAQPAGHLLDNTDCDDTSGTAASTFPGAASNDGAGCFKDVDGDDWGDDNPPAGVPSGTDCNDADAVLNPTTIWYADTDSDGFGDPGASQVQCAQPAGHLLDNTDCDDTSGSAAATFPGAAPNDGAACMKDVDSDDWGDDNPPAGVSSGTDCDDTDAVLNPTTIWYADTDSDTYGDPGVSQVQCAQPASHVLDNTDCDDTSGTAAATFPGAAPNDGASCMKDVDSDDWGDDNPSAGVTAGTDCDDSDAVLNPTTSWYADTDLDGFGDPGVSQVQCAQPAGHLLDNTDCDDTSGTAASTFPGAASNDGAGCFKDVDGDDWGDDNPPAGVPGGTDCNDADAVLNPTTTWYADTDSDGFGDPGASQVQCAQPAGHLLDNTDCDDTSGTAASTFPGAAPNDGGGCFKDVDADDWGDDNPPAGVSSGTDCDDTNSVLNPTTAWYADIDSDTYGDPGVSQVQCAQPASHVLDNTDCDDTSGTAAATFPGAAPNDGGGCFKDVDADDWGDNNPPAGVTAGTDCDDSDAVLNPTTSWYADTDLDGFGDPGVSQVQCAQPAGHLLDNTDCDDTSGTAAATFPGAAPNDGGGCYKDVDGDDWGDATPPAGVSSGTDCNDADSVLNPTTIWYADTDSDGFGDPGASQVQCAQPAGYLLENTDCDDTSGTAAATFPGAAPNDGGGCFKDVDGDDWGDDNPPAGVSSGTDCDDTDSVLNPTTIWYADTDADTFGDSGVSQVQCTQPASHVLDNTDCDDTSGTAAATFPGAAPNDGASCMKDVDSDDWGDDNPPAGVTAGTDCDDSDAVLNPTTSWYADTDLDGFGDPGVSQVQCAQPAGHLLDNTDCDDTSGTAAATSPGAAPNDGAGCYKDVDGDDWGDDNPPAGVTAGTDCDDSDSGLNPSTVWYADTDSDGFGDPGASQVQCAQPAGYLLDNTDCDDTSGTAASTFPGAAPNDGAGCFKDVDADDWGDDNPPAGVSSGTDCDDADSALNPTTIWYADTDADTFGDSGVSQVQCAQPASHVLDNTDCDDTSGTAASTFPNAAPNDGESCMKDVDSDDWGDDNPPAGVTAGTDCDDSDAVLNPTTSWYADTDLDGFGDPGVTLVQCAQPAGHLLDNTDCDDTSGTAASTFPGAASNDGAGCYKDVDGDDWGDDNPPAGVTAGTDCDDSDSGLNPSTVWYADTDSDGFGDPGVTQAQCVQPAGYLADNTDCDDTSATAASTFPGAAPNDGAGCLKDVDGDDWGDDSPPAGVSAGTDCDDADAAVHPTTTWFADADFDGFGDSAVSQVQCAQPASYVLDNTDCDDTSGTAAATFPGAAPNDGAGCLKDVDGDDWGDDDPPAGVSAGTDCDDADAAIHPSTTWYADTDADTFGDSGVSQVQCAQPASYVLDNTDCDDTSGTAASTFPGAAPNDGAGCMKDVDGDDWGDDNPPAGVSSGTDCNDDDAGIHPSTTWYADTDDDGFGDSSVTQTQCAQPADYVSDNTDCDDTSGTAADTYPGAASEDSAGACMKDVDGDDWGDDNPPAGVSTGTDCNDADAAIHPDTIWYADTDDDTYGDSQESQTQCSQPTDYVLDDTDCDDTSATAADTYPGAASEDSASACMKDVDGDDWGDDNPPSGVSAGTDCDDTDSVINPDTTWYADTDGDLFGDAGVTLTQCAQPNDYLLDDTDCDDTSATAADTFPGAAPNDNVSACMKDSDGDDWGDDSPPSGVTAGTDCDDADGGIHDGCP